MQRIKERLVAANKEALNAFVESLRERLDRMIEQVVIIPLYGGSNEFPLISSAGIPLTKVRENFGNTRSTFLSAMETG